MFAIGATVAVVAGILALQQGFALLYTEGGREDLAVFLRPGSTNEGDSIFSRARGLKLIKTVPEIAMDDGEVRLREWLEFATARVPEIHQEMIGAQRSAPRSASSWPHRRPSSLVRSRTR